MQQLIAASQALETAVHALETAVAELDSGKIVIPASKTDTGRLNEERREKARKTAKLILDTFNEAELIELCQDFDISYEDIEGETRREKVLHLVNYFYRRRTLEVFIHWLGGQRPHVAWPTIGMSEPVPPIE